MLTTYGDPIVFSGRGNRPLAEAICQELKCPLAGADVYDFPNEDIFIQLKRSVRGRDVFLVQGLGSPVSRNILELFIFIDALKRASAARITAVIPYFAYGRSDKKDQPRVAIAGRLMADLMITAGANRYLTIDLHAGQIQGFFSIPGDEISAMPVLVTYLQEHPIEDMVVVSADLGFAKKARDFAGRLNAPLAFVEKRRTSDDTNRPVEALTIIGDVDGRNAILVDELVDTAGTITSAAGLLKQNGARSVRIVCTHAALSGNAVETLRHAGIEEFICTNTLDIPEFKRLSNFRVLSVAPLLAEVIKRTHEARSVGEYIKDTDDAIRST
jgi:ribose-phosphate pyrophosphokinase